MPIQADALPAGEEMTDPISLYTLESQIAPFLPGCSDAVQDQALRKTGRDFCRLTHAWLELEVEITYVEGTTEYYPASAWDVALLTGKGLFLGGTTPVCSTALNHVVTPDGKVILAAEAPSGTTTLDFNAIWLPLYSCHYYPEWFVQRWSDAIVAGSLAFLQQQRGKPWYSDEWQLHFAEYNRLCVDAKRDGSAGLNQELPQRLKMPVTI